MAMLDTLKNLVYQKHLFSEAARLVLDDDNFDNLLLEDAGPTNPNLPEGTKDPIQNDNMEVQPEGEQPMPINTETEPSSAGSDDESIMNMEIDARTDTVSNVVPSPPANAGDQIDTADSPNGGDVMDQEISDSEDDDYSSEEPEETDSSDEEEQNMMDEEIPLEKDEEEAEEENEEEEESGDVMDETIDESGEESWEDEDARLEAAGIRIIDTEESLFNESLEIVQPYNSDSSDLLDEEIVVSESYEGYEDQDIFSEAISLDGDDSSSDKDDSSDDVSLPEPPKDDSAPDSDLAPEGDNSVTAAVKDKVNESNDDSSTEPSEPSEDDSSLNPTPATNNEELMKKIANVTKSQIDIMASLQKSQGNE